MKNFVSSIPGYKIYEYLEQIINRLKTIAIAFPSIIVVFKDFGSFPSHTIYIHITSKVRVHDLVTRVRMESQRLMKLIKENNPHFMPERVMTIARELSSWQYKQGGLEYSNKYFTGRSISRQDAILKTPPSMN